MKKWMALPIVALLTCTAGASAQDPETRAELELVKALEGLTPGTPQECISATFTQGPEIINDQTILYREGRKVWRNDLIGKCPSLKPSETIAIEVNGGQICHNDRFRVIPYGGGIPSAPCRLGKFVPYKK